MRVEVLGFLAVALLGLWALWQSLGADQDTLRAEVETGVWEDYQLAFPYTDGRERKTYQAGGGALQADFQRATSAGRARDRGEAAARMPIPEPSAPLPVEVRARSLFTWQANVELEPIESLTLSLPPDPLPRELPIGAAEWVDPRYLSARRPDENRAPVSFGPRGDGGGGDGFSMPEDFGTGGR